MEVWGTIMVRMRVYWLLHSFSSIDRSNLSSCPFFTFFVFVVAVVSQHKKRPGAAAKPCMIAWPHCSAHCVNLFQLFKVKMNGTLPCQHKPERGHVHPASDCCSLLSATQALILRGQNTESFNKTKWCVSLPEQPEPREWLVSLYRLTDSQCTMTILMLRYKSYWNMKESGVMIIFQTRNHL